MKKKNRDQARLQRGLEVDFSEFPEMSSLAILDAIHLPLRPGMSFQQIVSVLGEPEDTEAFVADRKSYNFTVGSRSPYYISATVHETDGLVFVSVIRKDGGGANAEERAQLGESVRIWLCFRAALLSF